MKTWIAAALMLVLAGIMLPAQPVRAHCDTLDGPVVADARTALAKGDITPVLKWVKPEHEVEVKGAFDQALAVRKLSPAAQELADRFFFETLVRVHRAGEGAPYTGLKPAGTPQEPGVAAADAALVTGKDEPLIHELTDAVQQGIHRRFTRTLELRQHAGESVAAGREYVEAYVEYVHYIEALAKIAEGTGEEHPAEPAAEEHRH